MELYTSNSFSDIKTWKILQSDLPRAFLYITWEGDIPKTCKFLQNHNDNYGAPCKPKNSTSMEKFFCQLQKALLLSQLFLRKSGFD